MQVLCIELIKVFFKYVFGKNKSQNIDYGIEIVKYNIVCVGYPNPKISNKEKEENGFNKD